jgi:isoleucyl-tRNA synthetase
MLSETSPFHAVPARIDLPAMERDVIRWWAEADVFERSLRQTAHGPRWICYEGPPTANGRPGVHHVEARVFKDVFPRFRTMKGYSVPRRAGWDCHGLPVELEVEKELGISGKADIERIGIAEFNARCRESVRRHVGEFEALTLRMGYWVDMSQAYWTMNPEYVDSVWWALAKIHADGLLVEDYRVAPYCPRCGTSLSDHEVAQGFELVEDPSVYVRLPAAGPVAGVDGVDLLVWTTTPWTLVSNTAVAVGPDITYVVARTGDGTFVVAAPLLEQVLGADAEVLATLPGRQLAGVRYRPPLPVVDIPNAHRVVLADYVTTEDGTGLVHQAPAFGAEDLAVGRENDLPVVNPIGRDGRFIDDVPLVGGLFFKAADPVIVAELKRTGLLFREAGYEHQYPFCWRCHTPLMHYAQLSWYIRTTQLKDRLLAENDRTTWYPAHIKYGRYGDWLRNNVDWALSRDRYWGTPLPLWRCRGGHVTAVSSRAELSELAARDLSTVDPHRPYIDDVTLDCPQCGELATRVSEVVDAWFDSGSMPFAQLGYPYAEGSIEEFAQDYPAQFICEAIDQTRGWFYTLMAVGTLLFDRSAYENVLCLGHILAEDGRKMSKHLGNILLPIPLMDRYGADALRWFMACSGSPWVSRRVGDAPLLEVVSKVLMTYWNVVSFFSLHASVTTWARTPSHERPVLDRWALARLHSVAATVDERLTDFDTTGAGRALAAFVDDLSNWYVRRSRRRFRDGDADALCTLYECLDVLTRLLAPFVPFVTEHVWREVIRPGGATVDSVHLASWPEADPTLVDSALIADVTRAQTVTEVGRAARKASGVRVRQPLRRALVGLPGDVELARELLAEVADELNVRAVEPLGTSGELVDVTVKANFRALGRRFAARTQEVAAAIAAADPAALAAELRDTGGATVRVRDEDIPLTPDELVVTEVPRAGWVVRSQQGVTVALDTEITPELRAAGIVRELIRLVQDLRKQVDLPVTDRISLYWTASGDARDAIAGQATAIADAVLADSIDEIDEIDGGEPVGDTLAAHHDDALGVTIWIAVKGNR